VHGRSEAKLQAVADALSTATVCCDLSDLSAVASLADELADQPPFDVLLHNAGVYKSPSPRTADGLDVRFVVNTLAPYLLTQRLLPTLPSTARVVTVASAAQSPVDLDALRGETQLGDFGAYGQSKLALIHWTQHLARAHGGRPLFASLNPGSLLATNMVREGFGIDGHDPSIGRDILTEAAVGERFDTANGRYFDNDAGDFGPPHPHARDPERDRAVTEAVHALVSEWLP
jgi:NAD(P)-dependent dehydrogenase (short-subunit alcohol dehydrogenase family)